MNESRPQEPAGQRTGGEPALGWKTIVPLVTEYGRTVLITLLIAIALKIFVVEAYRIPSGSMENTLRVGDFLLVNKLAYGLRSPRYFPLTDASIPSFIIPTFRSVHRGDIVVFDFPGNRDEVRPAEPSDYVKRCVGLPGDTVRIVNGVLTVNSSPIPFPAESIRPSHRDGPWHKSYQIFPEGSGYSDVNYGPVIVPHKGEHVQLDASNLPTWGMLVRREGHDVTLAPGGVMIDAKPQREYVVQRDYFFMLGDNRDNSLDSRYWGFVSDDRIIGEALFVYWSWDPDVPVTSVSDKIHTIRWNRVGTILR